MSEKDEEKFFRAHAAAEKLKATKRVAGVEIALGVQGHFAPPYWYLYYVNVGPGWCYYADFGTDYAKAKSFYDSIDWFAQMLGGQEEAVKIRLREMQDAWKSFAKLSDGAEIKTPDRVDLTINL